MSHHTSTTTGPAEPTSVLPVFGNQPWRRRRGIPALAAIAAAAVGLGISVVVLDGSDTTSVRTQPLPEIPTSAATSAAATATTVAPATTDTGSATTVAAPATTQAPVTTSPPPPSTRPERLTSASRLSLDGVGPVRIGMTLSEAAAAAGVPIRLLDMPPGPECRYAVPDRASGTGDELAFMVVDGRIVRIDVGQMGPYRIRTVSGMGKGNTEAEVQATYPGRIRVQPHPYIPDGRYLVYVPSDPALRQFSLIFETLNGEVHSFRAGFAEPVSWIEGCS